MKKSWNVEVNGVRHTVEVKTSFGFKVTVDGQMTKLRSQNWAINMLDHPLPIEGADVRLVIIGSQARLAVNGVYQENNEPYLPLERMPAMANTFMLISIIGGFFLGGIFCGLIGILFSMLYAKLGIKGRKGALVGAFIGCGFVQLLVILFVIGASVLGELLL